MSRTAVIGAAIVVVLALALMSFGLGLEVGSIIVLLVQLIGLLAFLALATWVVASVWKSVQHR
jgi:hypothetical protein